MSTDVLRRGLDSAEAERRLAEHGPNALPEPPPEPMWRRIARQFQSALIYVLLAALALDLGLWLLEGAHGWPLEAAAIALILALNAGLGAFQEYRAEDALAHLKALAAPQTWVLRDGALVQLPSRRLVPGDVVRLEAGDRVPADGVLLQAQGVMVDESVLTGESLPVEKETGDECSAGTLLVRGTAYVEVRRTGAGSSMGRLAAMLGQIEAGTTPLERRLNAFGHQVARWVFVLAVGLIVGGVLVEGLGRANEVFLFAVALAVAAIPEGLPAVLTLTLALGVERMARRRAVVRRLAAVEALGSVTVIATDKTGTLTENRLQVRGLAASDPERAWQALILANDAEAETGVGDPLEQALLAYARARGLDVPGLRRRHPRTGGRPFDSVWKFMRVTVEDEGRQVSYLKGAPEVLLARSALTPAEARHWSEQAEAQAAAGYRVLALATGAGEAETELTWLGLVSLWDPPRPEVPDAIRQAQAAGVRVVMVTGDHPATALAVARSIGIPGERVVTGPEIERLSPGDLRQVVPAANVFARVSPAHKLAIVEALKARGEIVAMTGDGVNDAPALKRSDVGVAMGQRGSDVTREVADLVLLDDNFATIVAAIEEGRSVYENIQKFIRFLFSTNLALVLLVVGGALGASWLGLRTEAGLLLLPLTAIQLLWINFIADGPPALALGLDRNPGVMAQPPRAPASPLLDARSLRFVVVSGVAKAAVGLGLLVLLPGLGYGRAAAQSGVFIFESVAQLVFAYPARHLSVQPRPNVFLHLAVGLGIGLQLLTLLVPGLRELLGLVPLDLIALTWVTAAVLVTWGVAEAVIHLGAPRQR